MDGLIVCVNGIEQPPFEFKQNGASLVERDQRQYMEEAGYEVYTVRPKYPEVEERDHEVHLSSIWLPGTDNYRIAKPIDCLTQRRLDKWIGGLRPDMIYLHGPYQIADRLARCAKRYGIPYVLHLHTNITGYTEARTPRQLWPVAKRFALSRAKRLADGAIVTIFPSKHYEAVFTAETGFVGTPLNSLVFPSHIQPFPILSKKELERANYFFRKVHLKNDPVLYPGIVVLGRLEEEKNPEYPLRCFAALVDLIAQKPIQGIESPVLTYVGGGTANCRDRLVRLAYELGISSLVYFSGARSNEESKEILQISNQCWFLSNKDTQGIVPLEAGYAGIPVFGLKGQPFEEFFGQKEFLVVPEDTPSVLAERSYILLKSRDEYSEMADHCRRVAFSFSDTEKYRKDLLDLCQHVVIETK